MSDIISILNELYGNNVTYNDFCELIQKFGDVNYSPYLEVFTDYIPKWKMENNCIDINTARKTTFAIHPMQSTDKITVNITFSTVEKFMSTDWRIMSFEDRQAIRMSYFNKYVKNYDSFSYHESTTIMGQCKWLITYKYSCSVNTLINFPFDDIKPLLEKMKTT